MASVLFIYGSTGGNTEIAVEIVAESLRAIHKVVIQRAEKSRPDDLLKYDVAILASPTYGHGLLQEHMRKFTKGLKQVDLKGKSCAVIALGDPKYEAQYHLESAVTLEKILTGIGGKLLLPALRISRTPVMHLKGIIPFWTSQLLASLASSKF